MRPCDLGIAALLALLFDLVHAPPLVLGLGLEFLEFGLELVAPVAPCVAVRLDLLLLMFKIGEGLLQRLRQLLLGGQVLLDGANACLLILLDL